MGGPRLTPEQLELAAEVFAKTNNTCAAAASIGVAESTLRAAFARNRIARNRDLHRAAVERGLRRGRKHLSDAANLLGEQLVEELRTEGLEPLERLQCASALSAVMLSLTRLALLDLKARQARLTRAQTRIAIAKANKELNGDGSDGPKLTIPVFLLKERPDNDGAAESSADPKESAQ